VQCEKLIHRFIDDSSPCIALLTPLRFFTKRKCDLRKVEKATVQVLTFHFELNFSILTSSKCDLDEFDKAKIHVLKYHFELIFSLLTSPKCDLRKFEKAVFQALRNLSLDLSLLTFNFEL